jgi:enoyl-[acyl-carrier-protein] reductase (NADH)
MALTEKIIVDKIEVIENNSIQIRIATVIEKDGAEVAKTYHRHVVAPGEDITNEDAKVQAIANAIWTEDVINNYKALIKPIEPIVPEVTTEPEPTDNNLE